MIELTAEKGLLFHFTHKAHLRSILMDGIWSDTQVRSKELLRTEAGDPSIKEGRRGIDVPCGPGGCVGDYVPFYYAPRSPMLYKISRGGVPTYDGRQEDLVYLVSSVSSVQAAELPYVISDGNCASAMTTISTDLGMLNGLDWEILNATMWSNTADDPDRMRRRMAEFLVHEHVPTATLVGVAVMTTGMKAELQEVVAPSGLRLVVRPDWYY